MRLRNEDYCPDYITKLLRRNSDDLMSDSGASRYGRFNLVCPFYNRETEGGRTFKVRGAKLWNRIPLDMRMRKKDTAGSFNIRNLRLGPLVHQFFCHLSDVYCFLF